MTESQTVWQIVRQCGHWTFINKLVETDNWTVRQFDSVALEESVRMSDIETGRPHNGQTVKKVVRQIKSRAPIQFAILAT